MSKTILLRAATLAYMPENMQLTTTLKSRIVAVQVEPRAEKPEHTRFSVNVDGVGWIGVDSESYARAKDVLNANT